MGIMKSHIDYRWFINLYKLFGGKGLVEARVKVEEGILFPVSSSCAPLRLVMADRD